MNLINHLMTIYAIINEIEKPVRRRNISCFEKIIPVFMRSSPVAASIVGTARRNENSTAIERLRPRARPPIIVAAARETPGMMASDWNIPMRIACKSEIEDNLLVAVGRCL